MKRAFGMAPTLLAAGHRVTVLVEDHGDNLEAAASVPGLAVRTFAGGLTAWAEAAAKERWLGELTPEVVHLCGLGWRNFLHPAAVPGALFLPDHVELESSLPGTSRLRRTHIALLEWRALARYRQHVAASRYLVDLWTRRARRLGRRRAFHYFPYAVEPTAAPDAAAAVAYAAHRPAGRYVLYAGGFYRNYGFFTLLEATAMVAATVPGFHLVLLGRGPEQAAGEDWVRAHGLGAHVSFGGYVPVAELPLWLAGADALLSPLHDTVTDWARCPSKIPLYMAARRPVVTCRIGEAEAYLGALGHYYEPGSAASLAATLAGLWAEGRKPPVPYALEHLSWAHGTASWLAFVDAHRKGSLT
jgi:glycosyltransferase involved in cell wall biosynthesis